MVAFVQESNSVDTTGLNDFFAIPEDYLTLPDAKVQRLQPNETGRAYTHINDLQYAGTVLDLDTFVVRLEANTTYRMQLQFDEPFKVQGNKIAYMMDAFSNSWLNKELVLSHSVNDPYQENSTVYSISYRPERTADHLIALETGTSGAFMVPLNPSSSEEIFSLFPQSYASPYSITVYDVSKGLPDSSPTEETVREISQPLAESVALLYEAALDREPDVPGLNYWLNEVAGGLSELDVAWLFLASDEFQQRFDVANDVDYVDQLYLNVLDRSADQAGKDYWVEQFDDGMSRAEALIYFSISEENIANAQWLSGLTETDNGWVI